MTKAKAKASTSTEVAVMGQGDIPKMLDMVNDQIKKIKGGLPDQPHTDKELPGFGKVANIKTVDDLIKAASMVRAKEKAYNEAAKEIIPEGMKKPVFKLQGITAGRWIEDISARVIVVGNKEQLDKLIKVKKKLEENLSAESKLARDLVEIQSILKVDED
jgi:hypothetical protein